MAETMSRKVTCAGLLITYQKAVKLTCSSPLIPSENQTLLLEEMDEGAIVQKCARH